MNITIIGVGKIKEKYLKLGIDEFSKRLTKYCKLDVIELDDEKCPENLSEKDMLIVKDKEGKKILSKIKNNSYDNSSLKLKFERSVVTIEIPKLASNSIEFIF